MFEKEFEKVLSQYRDAVEDKKFTGLIKDLFHNPEDVKAVATAVKAEQDGAETVGIITPYAAQTRLIRAMIRDYYEHGTNVVSCATVHQFQGSESDVLIFDAVESYPTNKVGLLMGKVPSEVIRLINVAITRARGFRQLCGFPTIS